MIPKHIAFFWSGGSLSWLRYLTLKTFCDLNPTWDIYLYVAESNFHAEIWKTPETQDYTNYVGDDWMPAVRQHLPVQIKEALNIPCTISPIHQCDMFQWWWLSTHGGWYSDLDIVYLQPMDQTYEGISEDCDMVLSIPRQDFTIGFLGCAPGNKFYQTLYQLCGQEGTLELGVRLNEYYQGFGIHLIQALLQETNGYKMVTELSNQYEYVCHIIPSNEDVYPWNWRGLEKIWEESHELPRTQLGIHWFAGAAISQRMNNDITPTTLTKYPCTLTNYIKLSDIEPID